MIFYDEYEAFRRKLQEGDEIALNAIRSLDRDEMYTYFCQAFSAVDFDVIEKFVEFTLILTQIMIAKDDFYVFRQACKNGNLHAIEALMVLAPAQIPAMIEASDFYAFRLACANGHLQVMEILIQQAPEQVLAMIEAKDFYAFRHACLNGHQPVIDIFMDSGYKQMEAMIAANDFEVFRIACKDGNLSLIKKIMKHAPNQILAMIESSDFVAFRHACRNGHLPVVEILMKHAPEKIQTMIATNNFEPLVAACRNGHLSVIEILMEFASNQTLAMMETKMFLAFRVACDNGHLSVIEELMDRAPKLIQAMIAAKNFAAFRMACMNGHLSVIEKLMDRAPGQVAAMIASLDFYAFRHACRNGHLPVVEILIKHAPKKIHAMIAQYKFESFRQACSNDHLPIIEKLIALVPEQTQDMIAASDFSALSYVKQNNSVYAASWLVHPKVFAFAEMHEQKFGDIVQPFIEKTLAELHQAHMQLTAANETAMFDIFDEDKATNCFYIIRNIIRGNTTNDALLAEILFLIGIPSVKALLHQEVTPGKSNELLRLAVQIGNKNVAQLLLQIPAVYELAVQNDYYRSEAGGRLDLAALALNRRTNGSSLRDDSKRLMFVAEDKKRAKDNKINILSDKLSACGPLGQAINAEIHCLAKAVKSRYPIWKGASIKLNDIIELLTTIDALTADVLQDALKEEMPLFQALHRSPHADKAYCDKITEALQEVSERPRKRQRS